MEAEALVAQNVQALDDDLAGGLRFAKYTSFGNTFIIVDETLSPLIDDDERAAFARWVLNGDFGVGGTDNVLYLRREADDAAAPNDGPATVFRIFEQDGSETLSCGNGLLCTAAVLRADGRSRWRVLTELPTGDPQPVQVGVGDADGTTWVNVGWPRAVPPALHERGAADVPASGIDAVDDLIVALPREADWAHDLPASVTLSGSLVFTGEPHLVLISGHGLPSVLADRLFPPIEHEPGPGTIGLPPTAAMRRSNLLVDHIGRHVNETYRARFPLGVHLNFARVRNTDPGLIEYRTYERAIDCETLACGSGAVAMAYVAQQAGLVSDSETAFWPHRCRWYEPDAELGVAATDSGFVLTGHPRLVCAGIVDRPQR